jgi:hypothetical protein
MSTTKRTSAQTEEYVFPDQYGLSSTNLAAGGSEFPRPESAGQLATESETAPLMRHSMPSYSSAYGTSYPQSGTPVPMGASASAPPLAMPVRAPEGSINYVRDGTWTPGSVSGEYPSLSSFKSRPYRANSNESDRSRSQKEELNERRSNGKSRKRRCCLSAVCIMSILFGLAFALFLSAVVYLTLFQDPRAYIDVIEIPDSCSQPDGFAMSIRVIVINPSYRDISIEDAAFHASLSSGASRCVDVCCYGFPSGMNTQSTISVPARGSADLWIDTVWNIAAFQSPDEVRELLGEGKYLVKIKGTVVVKQLFLSTSLKINKVQGYGVVSKSVESQQATVYPGPVAYDAACPCMNVTNSMSMTTFNRMPHNRIRW